MKLVSYPHFEKMLLELFSTIDDVYDKNNYQSDYIYNIVIPIIKCCFKDYFTYHQNIRNLSLRLYTYSTEHYNKRYSGFRLIDPPVINDYKISYNCILYLSTEYFSRILSLVTESSKSDMKYMNKNIRKLKSTEYYLDVISSLTLSYEDTSPIVFDIFKDNDNVFMEEVIKILRLRRRENRYLPMIITTI